MKSFKFLDTEIDTKIKLKKESFVALCTVFLMSIFHDYIPKEIKQTYIMISLLLLVFGLVYSDRGFGLFGIVALIVALVVFMIIQLTL